VEEIVMARRTITIRLPKDIMEDLELKKKKYNKPISRIIEEALRKIEL
jgi:predicted transcriptional regulator